jgi:hypothetical protein
MPGFVSSISNSNEAVFANNADFSGSTDPSELNGLQTDGQLWIGSTALNAGNTHINVGAITSTGGSVIVTYDTPNINIETLNNGTITSVLTANATPQFALVGTTETVDFSINNLLLGSAGSAITTGLNSVGFGKLALNSLTEGDQNTAIGYLSLRSLTTGSYNNCIGSTSGFNLTTGNNNTILGSLGGGTLSTGQNNVYVGHQTGNGDGSYNLEIGYISGINYLTTESSNILIQNSGVVGESNTLRIGTNGSGNAQINQSFIAGITGVTAAGAPVAVSSTGQLSDLGFGTAAQVLTSNGAAVSPTWQSPAFVGSPVYFQAYLTSNQNTTAGSTTETIIFNSAITNIGSAYNTGTGIFTAPSTGYYSFSATVLFDNLSSASGATEIILAYTGSVQSLRLADFGISSAKGSNSIIFSVSWSMPMTSGDTVKMQPYVDGSGTYRIDGASLSSTAFNTASTFSGFRIA